MGIYFRADGFTNLGSLLSVTSRTVQFRVRRTRDGRFGTLPFRYPPFRDIFNSVHSHFGTCISGQARFGLNNCTISSYDVLAVRKESRSKSQFCSNSLQFTLFIWHRFLTNKLQKISVITNVFRFSCHYIQTASTPLTKHFYPASFVFRRLHISSQYQTSISSLAFLLLFSIIMVSLRCFRDSLFIVLRSGVVLATRWPVHWPSMMFAFPFISLRPCFLLIVSFRMFHSS